MWKLTEEASAGLTVFDQVDCTNDWLLHRERVNPLETALTLNQTRGRGRSGRNWFSRAGDGLALSVILPDVSQGSQRPFRSGLAPSLTVGVSLLRALIAVGITEASLKWPNDILIGEDKLAGILCELRPDGAMVAGVGINLRSENFPADIRAASLDEFWPQPVERIDELVASFLCELDSSLISAEDLRWEAAREVLATLGREVEIFSKEGESIHGRAVELGPLGELICELSDGARVSLTSSDIVHTYQ